MICMPQDIYREHQIAWFNYRDGVGRMSFCGYEGYANRGACSYRGIPGAGNIGRACLVGGVNECGFGHCEPLASRGNDRGRRGAGRRGRHARIGVCIQ
jgi:hypothetical protein